MKKLSVITSICVFTVSVAFAGAPSESDQKWLQVVEKKVNAGQNQISTPAKERVSILKEWASSNGYTAHVTKTEGSFRVELTKTYAQK